MKSIGTISPRARVHALDLARTAASEHASHERRQQARRHLLHDTICVYVGGTWRYALPHGGTTDSADVAVDAWAAQ